MSNTTKDFLNKEENLKVKAIQEYLKNIDFSVYNNRFDNFESPEIKYIDWNEIEEWINILAEKISNKEYTGIYGVPRGGIILATLLSYKTNIPLLLAPQGNCLIIDDDISTGITLLPYINRYDIAVMYKNPQCKLNPTYLYKEYDDIYREFIWNKGGK